MQSRRSFLQLAALGAVPFLAGGCVSAGASCCSKADKKVKFQFGMAGYTMHKFNLEQTLDTLKKTDIHNLCVKDFHLPLHATDAEIKAFKDKCAAAGVTPYAAGPLYTRTNEDVRRFFAYAKRLGVKTIVGVPYDAGDAKDSWNKRKGSRKQLEYIDTLVKEFDIRYAIHNHGPASPEMYPDVSYGWNLVKDLDSRIGFCMDVGWEYGTHDAAGREPMQALLDSIHTYGSRIYDLHFKNFELNRPNGRSIPLPRGKIDFVRVMQALVDIDYRGVCALEYERDFDNNLAAIAECVGYWRGIADTLDRAV